MVSGGVVDITIGEHNISLTLTADRYWVVAHVHPDTTGGPKRIVLFDAATASSLLLDASTGSELRQTIPDDAPTELSGYLDAIAASAQRADADDNS